MPNPYDQLNPEILTTIAKYLTPKQLKNWLLVNPFTYECLLDTYYLAKLEQLMTHPRKTSTETWVEGYKRLSKTLPKNPFSLTERNYNFIALAHEAVAIGADKLLAFALKNTYTIECFLKGASHFIFLANPKTLPHPVRIIIEQADIACLAVLKEKVKPAILQQIIEQIINNGALNTLAQQANAASACRDLFESWPKERQSKWITTVSNNATPLQVACHSGNHDLLQYFFSLLTPDEKRTALTSMQPGYCLLHSALASSEQQTIKFLLSLLKDYQITLDTLWQATDSQGCTILHYCALANRLEVLDHAPETIVAECVFRSNNN